MYFVKHIKFCSKIILIQPLVNRNYNINQIRSPKQLWHNRKNTKTRFETFWATHPNRGELIVSWKGTANSSQLLYIHIDECNKRIHFCNTTSQTRSFEEYKLVGRIQMARGANIRKVWVEKVLWIQTREFKTLCPRDTSTIFNLFIVQKYH